MASLRYLGLHLLALVGFLAYVFIVLWTLLVLSAAWSNNEAYVADLEGYPNSELGWFDFLFYARVAFIVVLLLLGAASAHRRIWTPVSDWWYKKRAAMGTEASTFRRWRQDRHNDPREYSLDC